MERRDGADLGSRKGHKASGAPCRGRTVTSASFDPTGESLLTTSADGRAPLAAVRRPPALRGKGADTGRRGVQRAGNAVAVAGPRGVVVVDPADGKRLAELPADRAKALAVSADSGAVASARGKQVEIWRVSDGQRLGKISSGAPATALAFRRDGGSVTAGTRAGAVVLLDNAKILQGRKRR